MKLWYDEPAKARVISERGQAGKIRYKGKAVMFDLKVGEEQTFRLSDL